MLFQKLFRVLVVSGSMMGLSGATGCAANAAGTQAPKASDGGTVASAPDAGTAKPADTGGGAPGW